MAQTTQQLNKTNKSTFIDESDDESSSSWEEYLHIMSDSDTCSVSPGDESCTDMSEESTDVDSDYDDTIPNDDSDSVTSKSESSEDSDSDVEVVPRSQKKKVFKHALSRISLPLSSP